MGNPFIGNSGMSPGNVQNLQSQFNEFMKNAPQNPQQVINQMVQNGQVSQPMLNKAIQIANMLSGFFR